MTNTRSPRSIDEDEFSSEDYDAQSSTTLQATSTSSARLPSISATSSVMNASSSKPVISHYYSLENPDHEEASSPSAPFSSFSSYVTSPKLLQKTFSNLMSRSWTVHDNDDGVTSSSFVGQFHSQPRKPVKPAYVSKEKQVERLRARMQREGLKSRLFIGMCKKCEDDIVYL
jgi:hypothetical protein